MTKEEAIRELELYVGHTYGDVKEALVVAIDSIKKLSNLEKWMEEKTNE